MNTINHTPKIAKTVNYLRISVTDRCNLRCNYCMPKEGIALEPHENILSFEEIVMLVRIFASLGVSRIRLTGGEPLARKGVIDLLCRLNRLPQIEKVSLTTNGTLLPFYARDLKKAGVNGINISLDTLNKERFVAITGSNCFHQAIEGIELAKKIGFAPIKLNVVIMKGVNADEIGDFVRFACSRGLILRFIEFMKVTPLWKEELYLPLEEIKNICHRQFSLKPSAYRSLGPAEYYTCAENLIGFIRTAEENCRICSRLRLTALGELKSCLYQPQGLSLRNLLRAGAGCAEIKEQIERAIGLKAEVDYNTWDESRVYMCSVGG